MRTRIPMASLGLVSFAATCGVLVLLASSANATPIDCNCPPSIIVFIDGTGYSASFVPTTNDGATFFIAGTVVTESFAFSLNATTRVDTLGPSIEFGLSFSDFSGDPTVGIRISQFFLAGPFPDVLLNASATLTDLSGDGHASLLGGLDPQNIGCDLTGTQGFTAPCPPAPLQSLVSGNVSPGLPGPFIPPSGTLQLDITFALSDLDSMALQGSLSAAAEPVPEPHAGVLIAIGLVALALARSVTVAASRSAS